MSVENSLINKTHRVNARSKDVRRAIFLLRMKREDRKIIINNQLNRFIQSFPHIRLSSMEKLTAIRSQMEEYMLKTGFRLYDANNHIFYRPYPEIFTILVNRYEDITKKMITDLNIAETKFKRIFEIPETEDEEEVSVSIREYSYDPSVYLENIESHTPSKKNKPFKLYRNKDITTKLLTNFNLYSPEANLIFELTEEQKLTDYDSIMQIKKQEEEDEMNSLQWDDICTSNVRDRGPCWCCGGFVRDD